MPSVARDPYHSFGEQLSVDKPFLFRIGHAESYCVHFPGEGVISTMYYSQKEKKDMKLARPIRMLDNLSRPPLDSSFLDHMDWNCDRRTPFISASRSPLWTIWRAEWQRSCRFFLDRSVEFIIVDAFTIVDAVDAREVIRTHRNSDYPSDMLDKFSNCARIADEVTLTHYIPETSIICSLQWDNVRTLLPPWFFNESNEVIPIPRGWSQFRNWREEVESRFYELRLSESSCREAAVLFAFALLSYKADFSWLEEVADRLIDGAISIAQSILLNIEHQPIALENLLRRLMLDKWPIVLPPFTPKNEISEQPHFADRNAVEVEAMKELDMVLEALSRVTDALSRLTLED